MTVNLILLEFPRPMESLNANLAPTIINELSDEIFIDLMVNAYLLNHDQVWYIEEYIFQYFEDIDFGIYDLYSENIPDRALEQIHDLQNICLNETTVALKASWPVLDNLFKEHLNEINTDERYVLVDRIKLLPSKLAAIIAISIN